jgi:hypothetical protein
LVQNLLSVNKKDGSTLDKVDQSFNVFQESLENQDIASLMKMYADKTIVLCGYDMSTFVKHSNMIDSELLKQLQAVVQQNIVLTHEQYQVLMNLEKRDIN